MLPNPYRSLWSWMTLG
eukprot:CCRYP_001680-RA/>CCRYP_001680-RA protein AED:0.49 eAED:1.00 QI:0/-1/0/1/-1/0/1/0/16